MPRPAVTVEATRVIRVRPDVVGIDKTFDYLVPTGVEVHIGDLVRVDLHGRRVGGWVVALDPEPLAGVNLKPVAKISGRGPRPDVIDLAEWAAWRWAGRPANLLRTASPPAVVRSLPARSQPPLPVDPDPLIRDALVSDRGVLRLPPMADRYRLIRAAVGAPTPVADGRTLVLCPTATEARELGARLRRDGVAVAVTLPEARGAAGAGSWAHAASGAVVVGTRSAAWAPVAPLGRVVVLDEHDDSYQQEQSPTWHAREVVTERARRAGAPCLLVSPCPSLEALEWGELMTVDRSSERRGWPRTRIVDQRDLDPALGPLFSPALVDTVRGEGRVLCVLNRTGRVRLLACRSCASIARCAACDAAVRLVDDSPSDDGVIEHLRCGRCGTDRASVCLGCGGSGFKNLRLGVSRAREELEVLAGEPVAEVTATTDSADPDVATARIVIGTEAVLHRVTRADSVAFLDFDQELLALRYRAAEQALALLARAARVVRTGSGGLLIQTRSPEHPVLTSLLRADPGRLAAAEVELRRALRLPPAVAMALVSGQAAEAYVESLRRAEVGSSVEIQGPVDGTWRIRAPDHRSLCDALAGTERPPGRLRIEVDPRGA